MGLAWWGIATLGNAATEYVGLVAQPLDGEAPFQPPLGEIGAAQVAQFNVLELVPDALVRIQVRGLAGESLHLKPRRCPVGEEVLDRLGAVDRRPIPEHQQLALKMA